MIDFTPEQLALLTAATVLIPWLIVVVIWIVSKLLGSAWKPPEVWLKILVFVVSVVLAFLWTPKDLKVPLEPGEFAMRLIVLALAVFKLAQIVYDYLWTPIMLNLDKILTEKFGRSSNPVVLLRP